MNLNFGINILPSSCYIHSQGILNHTHFRCGQATVHVDCVRKLSLSCSEQEKAQTTDKPVRNLELGMVRV